MGNRLSRADSVAGTTTSAYNAANMLLVTGGYGASSFQNDADGNTLLGNGRTNAWDSQNRLVSCLIGGNSSTYKYAADGLRRQKTANGMTTDYAYDGTMMVREGHASSGSLTPSTVTATYLVGARGPEYRRDDTQTEMDSQGRTVTKARWYVYDGLGSVVGEVDPLGNLTSSTKYDVYGAVRANAGAASSRQGFVGSLGHVSDVETGLIYMRARYYDPSAGRFVSQDPKFNGENWLIYCMDNPINSVDQDGKDSIPELLGYIGQFMLSALSCRTFQISMAGLFLATLACILAPLAFVVGCGIPFGGLCGGAALAIMTVQAISAMMAAVAASPGVGAVGSFPSPTGIYGPVWEIYNTIAGYGAGLYLIMVADDAYQELT